MSYVFPEEAELVETTAFYQLLKHFKALEMRTVQIHFPVEDKERSYMNIGLVLDNIIYPNARNAEVLQSAAQQKLIKIPQGLPLIHEIKIGDHVLDYDWNVPLSQVFKVFCEVSEQRLLSWDQAPHPFYPMSKRSLSFFWLAAESVSERQDFVTLLLSTFSPYILRIRNEFSISTAFFLMFLYGLFEERNVATWLESYDEISQVITLREGVWNTENPLRFKQKLLTQESGDPTPYIVYEFLLARAFDARARHLCVIMNALIECRYYLLQGIWDTCFPQTLYVGLVSTSYLTLVVIPWLKSQKPDFWHAGAWRHLVLYITPASLPPAFSEIKEPLREIVELVRTFTEQDFVSIEAPERYRYDLIELFPYFENIWVEESQSILFEEDLELQKKRQRLMGDVKSNRVQFEDISLANETENFFEEEEE